MRRRGELLERTFAHCLETGAMRRVHLRGRANILKRYVIHVAAFNLSLVMRQIFGVGTPRGLQGRLAATLDQLRRIRDWLSMLFDLGRGTQLHRLVSDPAVTARQAA